MGVRKTSRSEIDRSRNSNRLPSVLGDGPIFEIVDRGYKTPCWIWLRSKHSKGYGRAMFRGVYKGVHIHMYEMANGPIPVGMQVDHLCCQTSCARPGHLEAVSGTENVRRSRGCLLTPATVSEMKKMRADGMLLREVAEKFGVGLSTVSAACTGQNWSDHVAN